ncbi:lantibiotic dehydratase [Kitasatospora sp. NPDC057512]|uniref:lantibiotic dehydratase n=1 Tax=Kitasatospora sp. NPDC057512 TaxID=3346154 RepID=UPI0036742DF1
MEPGTPVAGHPTAWSVLPLAFLRQAGFPLDLLDPLLAPEAARQAERAEAADAAERAAAGRLRGLLHREALGDAHADITRRLGQGQELRPRQLRLLEELGPDTARAVEEWRTAARSSQEVGQEFARSHRTALDRGRAAVLAAFDDEALRQMLLLSNDAQYDFFTGWLDSREGPATAAERGRIDTLARYLQRACTKNETHSHFGPFTPARLTPQGGPDWSTGAGLVRTAFMTHWAAQALASTASSDDRLVDRVRPRRRPLTFLLDGRVERFQFATDTVSDFDNWQFRKAAERALTPVEEWILRHGDGGTELHALRELWRGQHPEEGEGGAAAFDAVVADLKADGWLIAEFEVPSGTVDALGDLRAALPAHPDADGFRRLTDELRGLLAEFAQAEAHTRPELLDRIKRRFEEITGQPANRGQGDIYADRSVLFEECRSTLRDLTVGGAVTDFLSDELTLAYDLVLVLPRLRIQLETELLHRWSLRRYGPGHEVPLRTLYEDFFADVAGLTAEVDAIERQLADKAAEITAVLLPDDAGAHRVEVAEDALRKLLGSCRTWPGAVLNPDVMFVAKSADQLAAGDFLAVIGDCHAVRDLQTHTSIAPLLAGEFPELPELVARHYAGIVAEDEVVVDIVREHGAKTSARVDLGQPDFEVAGRSPRPRAEVITPESVFVRVTDQRLELRDTALPGRLRLMAAPAGTPSILGDPLSVFAFPRHFGGGVLPVRPREHTPRITCGRVVLQREEWRIPVGRLTGDRPGGDDAADFAAARRLRAELGLPAQVFAKVASEPKPVYVDWNAPLLVRQLFRMARTDGGKVTISEMLPGPDSLWFSPDGRHYTCELRCTVFSPGDDA